MAEVMNDVNENIGKLEENEDPVKLNGDANNPNSENENENESETEVPQSKDKCINRKHSNVKEPVGVDKLIESTSVVDKSVNVLANGHIKAERATSDHSVSQDQKSCVVESNTDIGRKLSSEIVSEDTSDRKLPNSKNNEDNLVANQQLFSNKVDINSSSSVTIEKTNENQVLNLKTTHGDPILGRNISVCELPRTDTGLSITVVSTKSNYDPNSKKDQMSEELKTDGKSSNANNDDHALNDEDKLDDSISICSSSEKHGKNNKKPNLSANITPRRSSRNLNKHKNYNDKDDVHEEEGEDYQQSKKVLDDDDVEEVTPTDPLAEDSKLKQRNKTIIVSDTKGLVEFASNARVSKNNKKEPTLVIIDTKSILSGRGPVPVSQPSGNSLLHSSNGTAPIPVSLPISASSLAGATRGIPASTSTFSVIPIGLPAAQGLYSQYKNPPPQMKPIVVGPASTTVTPISIQPSVPPSSSINSPSSSVVTVSTSAKQPPIILPSLTDDMFVVEAPSFIVPYVYEKPPMKALKGHLEKIEIEIKDIEEKSKEKIEVKSAEENSEKEEVTVDEKMDESDDKVKEKNKEKPDEKSNSESIEDGKETEKSEKIENTESPMETSVEETNETTNNATDADVSTNSSKNTEISTTDKKDSQPSVPTKDDKKPTNAIDDLKKPLSYFDNPLGQFFVQIGLNLVQEHVQTDLLRSQKRKRDKEGESCSPEVTATINELTKTLESSKENNDPFKLDLKKCELCSFKTESLLVMAHHLETPHMKNYTYRCNFCPLEVRSPHDILFHMEAEHNVRGRLERAPAFHQCPNCPFEDNQKGKLTRHMVSCLKKYRPERNQEAPLDWEPPAKIPRVTRNRPPSMSPGNAVYQAAMSGLKQVPQNTLLPKLMPNSTNVKHNVVINANKKPNTVGNTGFMGRFTNTNAQANFQQRSISAPNANQGLMYRTPPANSQTQVLLPPNYNLSSSSSSMYQNPNVKQSQQSLAAAKLLNQPSISITPLPRQTSGSQPSSSNNAVINSSSSVKNSKSSTTTGGSSSKNSFVVCEICDGYIKDLEQLRNHMQWIHKVKIHPKMIYNRPPLNCQKCQFRFFTDQGLERHLLGSHGLVTSSMQEAANKGKDGGRCPVCGRVYQWKLLNHVARDHQMALKPAHLSYKCTVCTATFGMYKQFESHVYSAHSVVAKRAMDPKKPAMSSAAATSSQNDALLKPLKINDEITIIPQPVRSSKLPNKISNNSSSVINSKSKV